MVRWRILEQCKLAGERVVVPVQFLKLLKENRPRSQVTHLGGQENSKVEICVWCHCHRKFQESSWGKGRRGEALNKG